MAVEAILAAAAKPIAKEVVRKSFDGAWELISQGRSWMKFREFKTNYLDYCERILKTKTLASREKALHIEDFYVPLNIISLSSLNIYTVNSDFSFKFQSPVLIKGVAGQGKSTLLKKMLVNNAVRQGKVSIYYELKNYDGGDLESAILKTLNVHGANLGLDELDVILSYSKTKLFLDAFDEVRPEFRSELLLELRRVINSYYCQTICSTRPDTEIETLSELEVFEVSVLTREQTFGIIINSTDELARANELCKAIQAGSLLSDQESVLESPILVVLLCILYSLGDGIPETLSQLYANVFDLLFSRHDYVKGGVKRPTYWNNNAKKYRDVFSCFCFASIRDGEPEFSREKLVELFSVSINHIGENSSASELVMDQIFSITNLLIEDGFNNYKFVHKSIQEYYAATFVLTMELERKQGFYNKCFSDGSLHSSFSQVLYYLRDLDYFDYYRYGFNPAIHRMCNIPPDRMMNVETASQNVELILLSNVYISFETYIATDDHYESTLPVDCRLSNVKHPLINRIYQDIKPELLKDYPTKLICEITREENCDFEKILEEAWWKEHDGGDADVFELGLYQLVKYSPKMKNNLNSMIAKKVSCCYKDEFNTAVSKLKNRNDSFDSVDYFNW